MDLLLLCDLCKTDHLQSHCERCDINLCKVCVGDHLSDTSIRHEVVLYQYRKCLNYSNCLDHADEHCKHYCEKCDIPVCSICVSSSKHEDHNISNVLEKLDSKTERLQKDLEELETRIFSRFEERASDIQTEKAKLETNYEKLIISADQQGEVLHREITAIVNQRKCDILEMKDIHLSFLNKETDETKQKITELKLIIADLKAMLKSDDVYLTFTYKCRNSEFRTLPPKVCITFPSFSPCRINKDQLNEIFGSLSSLSINTEYGGAMTSPEAVSSPTVKPMQSPEVVSSPGKPMKSTEAVPSPPGKPIQSIEAVSSPPVKRLHDEPQLTATINTGYKYQYSVSSLIQEQIWVCGNDKIMKLLNIQGELLTSVQTDSGNEPQDIAVTKDGDLVYTDPVNKTVNLVKNKQIRTVITFQGWVPLYVCSTASDDLLVTMISDDGEQSKVVRYSGSTATQTIQFDHQSRPLYSSGSLYDYKYISENRNLDICVADWKGKAVVVVNQSGNLRFRYTDCSSNAKDSFYPYGITTDSHSHILTTDCGYNGRIHILDQDGQFLRHIHNLRSPLGLCVDIRDNLFVAEHVTAKVKKIQYL